MWAPMPKGTTTQGSCVEMLAGASGVPCRRLQKPDPSEGPPTRRIVTAARTILARLDRESPRRSHNDGESARILSVPIRSESLQR
jgi:hypothetical protein